MADVLQVGRRTACRVFRRLCRMKDDRGMLLPSDPERKTYVLAHLGHTAQEGLARLGQDGVPFGVWDERRSGQPDILDGLGSPSCQGAH